MVISSGEKDWDFAKNGARRGTWRLHFRLLPQVASPLLESSKKRPVFLPCTRCSLRSHPLQVAFSIQVPPCFKTIKKPILRTGFFMVRGEGLEPSRAKRPHGPQNNVYTEYLAIISELNKKLFPWSRYKH
jgi:hypothetical protein